jgi:hypothetical protein
MLRSSARQAGLAAVEQSFQRLAASVHRFVDAEA